MQLTKKRRVLVVDDDSDIVELLQYNLQKADYDVRTASNGEEAIDIAKAFAPNLILIDIMMPKLDGVEASRLLRGMPQFNNTYIVFLTARLEEYSEIAAFNVGADDYVIKPIKPRALMGRIEALFRRDTHKKNKLIDQDDITVNSKKIEINDLVIDKTSYTLRKDSELVDLPKKEFDLLFFLAKYRGRVFSRDDLIQHIWGEDVYVLSRTVDVHIRKLRGKIGNGYISTVKGVGYKFISEEENT